MANIVERENHTPNPLSKEVDCITDYPIVDTGWIVKKWFRVDLEKLLEWYKNLTDEYQDWIWTYGKHKDMWKYDANEKTGGGIQEDTSWLMLTWGDDRKGPVPWLRYIAKEEYDCRMPQNTTYSKEMGGYTEGLGARECLKGYGLEILEKMPIPPHDVQVAIHTPGTKLPPHQDGHDKFRFHIVLKTNPDARFIINGQDIHLPADGWCYIVNTTYLHSTDNKGSEDRIHIYGNIWLKDVMKLELENCETVI